jgi:hypothetical protein
MSIAAVAGYSPRGTYVFGDFCTGEIFTLSEGMVAVVLDTMLNISSFGEDESGELYVAGLGDTVQLSTPIRASRRRGTSMATAPPMFSGGTPQASSTSGSRMATASVEALIWYGCPRMDDSGSWRL